MRTEIAYELDYSDESLHSLSSSNIICITPTKYKNTNGSKSDFECQCTTSRRRSETDQNRYLRICPSVLKAISKAVNTSKERKCASCCRKSAAVTTDSVVCVRIPQGVQCDHDLQTGSRTLCPQICFISSNSSRKNEPRTSCSCQTLPDPVYAPPSCPMPPCYRYYGQSTLYRTDPAIPSPIPSIRPSSSNRPFCEPPCLPCKRRPSNIPPIYPPPFQTSFPYQQPVQPVSSISYQQYIQTPPSCSKIRRPCPALCEPSPCRPCPQPCRILPSLCERKSLKATLSKLLSPCKRCSTCKSLPLRNRTPPPPPSRCSIENCPFRDGKPPSAPPGSTEEKNYVLHVPCELCGIPPCAAISSINCKFCNKTKSSNGRDFTVEQRTKNSCTPIRNVGFKSRSSRRLICKPCEDDFKDEPFDAFKDDDSIKSSPSLSANPLHSVSSDMSRSCESLDYPCKPLKPRVSDIEERPSVESLTCPSKRSVCPAKPPPCPGVGDRPCPSYPPKPCPSRKNAKFEEDHNSKRYGNERRSSHENDSVLFPVSIKSQSPLQDVRGRTNSSSESSSQDFRTHDDKPLMTSNLPSGIVREKIQMQISRNRADIPKQNDCNCKVECCKCSQTATHEEKDIQCPAFKQCTCQTEPKEDACVQCICKENVEPLGKNTNEDKGYLCQCETSSSSSTSRSNSSTSCICCKKQKILKNLADKIPLCEPCQEVNKSNFYPHDYSNPIHSCLCYNLVDRNLLYQFKDTLNELQRLEIYQQYCEVLKNCKCCKKCGCKCKLPKNQNGCAYFLKLEDDCPNSVCEEDNSNGEEEDRKNRLPEVTVKIPNCRGCCGRHRRDENWSKTNHYTTHSSIQNYLFTMKPEFVARAERRRKILRNATVQREENSEKRKLNFIEKIAYLNEENEQKSSVLKPYNSQTYCVFDIGLNNLPKKVQPKVFKSFKEMKELTRRKYLTLNEVKSKKNVYREKRLREANRLLANTFTRRLQRSTLRGTVDIPLNVRVVTF